MPQDPFGLVDVGDGQPGAFRQGQGAPVGGLSAAFRVKHRGVQRNAPAAGLGIQLGGKDDAVALGAERILFKVFFGALHGANTSRKNFCKTKYTTIFACGK